MSGSCSPADEDWAHQLLHQSVVHYLGQGFRLWQHSLQGNTHSQVVLLEWRVGKGRAYEGRGVGALGT